MGTLPVTFRGAVYKFPIDIWIPNTYPREPPIVYVTPTQDMVVRVGQHVTLEGRVYHHYLAHWAEAWEVSAPRPAECAPSKIVLSLECSIVIPTSDG